MNLNGRFIVLEGSDGAGKTTQFKLLAERLKAAGYDVDVYDFPRYDQPSSYFVRQYLNGEYVPAADVSPYTASLFYDLDRYEAAPHIRQSLADGKIVLADRYAGSNMAHQGSKFANAGEQRGFFVWADSLEFQLMGIPRPNINLFLRVPAEVSDVLIKKRDRARDEHENLDHMRKTVATFDTLCQLFPKDFKAIECAEDSKLLTITEINNRIWEKLRPFLPKPTRSGRSTIVNLGEQTTNKPSRSKLMPDKSVPKTSAAVEIKDISILAAINLLSVGGIRIERSINWQANDKKARINYYIPPQFSSKLAKKYAYSMDKLSEIYQKIENRAGNLPELQDIIPLAALCNVKIFGSNNSISELFKVSERSEIAEFRQLSKQLGGLKTPRGAADPIVKEPSAIKQIIDQLAKNQLTHSSSHNDDRAKILKVWPKNEFDLLVDILYPHSNLSSDDIAAELDRWSYQQKAEALKAACAQESNTILAKTKYRFDVIEELILINDVVNALDPIDLVLQPPTPRYGYGLDKSDMPAELEDLLITCFDLSLELYSDIQSAGFEELAPYSVLLGHRQRWQFSAGGQPILEYHSSSEQQGFRGMVELLREKIKEVHPIISGSLKMHNQKSVIEKVPINSQPTTTKAKKNRRARPKK